MNGSETSNIYLFVKFCIDNLDPPEGSIMAREGFRKLVRDIIEDSNKKGGDNLLKMLTLIRDHIAYFNWSDTWTDFYRCISKNPKNEPCPFSEKCTYNRPKDWICTKLFKNIYN